MTDLRGDPDFERGRQAAHRMMASVKVKVSTETVVRESDGATLLLVTTYAGKQRLGMHVIEGA